jgi:hypothetical protein
VSAAHDSLASALAAAQASYPAIGKGKHSPAFGGYDYADLARVLAAVRPALAAQGVALLQRFDLSEQGDTLLVTELLWRDQRITSRVPLKLAGLDNQKAGSAVTYWRRYSALAICGCAPEDEDDDGASTKDAPMPPARQQARSQESTAAREHAPPVLANGRGWTVSLPGETPVGPMPLQDAWTVLYRACKGDKDADGMSPAEIQEAKDMNRALYDAVTPRARAAMDELLALRSPKVA